MDSLFSVLEIGKPIQLVNLAPNTVLEECKAYFEERGIAASLTFWTDPPGADPALRCRMTYLLRCDGMTEDQIEALKNSGSAPPDEFLFDPLEWNESFPPDKRLYPPVNRPPKESKVGWERMKLGGHLVIPMHVSELRVFLGRAIVQRNLPWAFRCKRQPLLEKTGYGWRPVWLVTRIR